MSANEARSTLVSRSALYRDALGLTRKAKQRRDRAIVAAEHQGVPVSEIARLAGVSRAYVGKVVREAEQASLDAAAAAVHPSKGGK